MPPSIVPILAEEASQHDAAGYPDFAPSVIPAAPQSPEHGTVMVIAQRDHDAGGGAVVIPEQRESGAKREQSLNIFPAAGWGE